MAYFESLTLNESDGGSSCWSIYAFTILSVTLPTVVAEVTTRPQVTAPVPLAKARVLLLQEPRTLALERFATAICGRDDTNKCT